MPINPTENTPNKYVIIRLDVVEVKKTFFGRKDKMITFNHVITDTNADAIELSNQLNNVINEYSKQHGLIEMKY